VVAKAELFDEKIGIGSKPSGTRVALILTDYSENPYAAQSVLKLRGLISEIQELVHYT
jgi:hypothetical protein